MKNVQGTRRKVLFLAGLIAIGVILGSVVLYVMNSDRTGSWELELENGKIVLDAQDRAELKEKALTVTLEDEEIKELIAGKDYTTQVTLTGNVTVKDIIEDINVNQGRSGVVAEGDVNLIVVVTVTFTDGSGYNIPVDWQNWTVGEPEFAQQVAPPADKFRITGLDATRRTVPTERTTSFP